MTYDEFEAWRNRVGMSQKAVCELFGLSTNQPRRYATGTPIPPYIAYACAAVEHELPPVGAQEKAPAD
ncbi:helix-turn-helix domain-containing protein [Pannonibacter tanglangensis]|uniref:XRE family transcriptional regulator n=1 Tax=Pannonibacter tanglangensis TaxID=2750084 RepID=A0ABW9ZB40_9HYPH|nr:helix-turn-helix domain-containing protein [Pannonibacter sp. XCT-34]NBN62067.1 hypothetical protein [Pannonibacter sp. XCT-34]